MARSCFVGFLFLGAFPGLTVTILRIAALEGRSGPLALLWAFGLGFACVALVMAGRSEKTAGEAALAGEACVHALLRRATTRASSRVIVGAFACALGLLIVWCANCCVTPFERTGADAAGWLGRNVLASEFGGVSVSLVSLILVALVWALAFWVERVRRGECPSADSARALRIERGERS